MSKMSPKQRREVIREHVAMHSYPELAKMCNVTKRTIRRDVSKWKAEGGYDEFLLEQFFKLYMKVKLEDPKHAFDRICDLLRRRTDEMSLMAQVDQIELKWRENDNSPIDSELSVTPNSKELPRK